MFPSHPTDSILRKALEGGRLTTDEALTLYREGDFLRIQAAAREIRNRRVPAKTASYTMFRVVNYTNVCTIHCSFCSFKEDALNSGYVLSKGDVIAKMEEAVRQGANQLFLQGGVHPELPLDYYLEILSSVRDHFGPSMHIRAFSPVELLHLSRQAGLSLEALLDLLKNAGLNSVPGAGAEILTERMRRILSPRKATVQEWVDVMEACHRRGLPGSANIVFGSEETREEVIEHLRVIRDLQDRTGGFLAFVVWTFQQQTDRFRVRPVPPHEYLQVLGIARLFLDNIDHIEISVLVQGPVLGSLALHSGADDISSVVIEENVLKNNSFTREGDAIRFLRESGFEPRRRDFLYRYEKEAEAV